MWTFCKRSSLVFPLDICTWRFYQKTYLVAGGREKASQKGDDESPDIPQSYCTAPAKLTSASIFSKYSPFFTINNHNHKCIMTKEDIVPNLPHDISCTPSLDCHHLQEPEERLRVSRSKMSLMMRTPKQTYHTLDSWLAWFKTKHTSSTIQSSFRSTNLPGRRYLLLSSRRCLEVSASKSKVIHRDYSHLWSFKGHNSVSTCACNAIGCVANIPTTLASFLTQRRLRLEGMARCSGCCTPDVVAEKRGILEKQRPQFTTHSPHIHHHHTKNKPRARSLVGLQKCIWTSIFPFVSFCSAFAFIIQRTETLHTLSTGPVSYHTIHIQTKRSHKAKISKTVFGFHPHIHTSCCESYISSASNVNSNR